jgi:sialic acid synthase SpsE
MEKGLYYRIDLVAGEVLHAEHLDIRSPSAAMYPYEAAEVLGMQLTRDVKEGEAVSMEAVT